MQTKFNRTFTKGVSFDLTKRSQLLPNRVQSLEKLMSQFLSGRPVDQSLVKNLPYNDIENNPYFRKGLDLCDLPTIAREVDVTLQEATEQIQRAQQANISDPDRTPPEKVATE